MDCPECQTKLKIIDSRAYSSLLRIRKYKCPACGYENITSEELIPDKKDENNT